MYENRSSRSTYDVILDGINIGAIRPGENVTKIVAAGSHSLAVRFTNTARTACTTAYVNIAQCATEAYYCTSEQ